jgi:hypothetical protein
MKCQATQFDRGSESAGARGVSVSVLMVDGDPVRMQFPDTSAGKARRFRTRD